MTDYILLVDQLLKIGSHHTLHFLKLLGVLVEVGKRRQLIWTALFRVKVIVDVTNQGFCAG